MASTSETYQSGFGTTESNPLFRQSQSMASMNQYGEPSSMSNLALPISRGQRDYSSSESGPSIQRYPSDDPSSFSSHSHGHYPSHAYSPEAPMYPDEDQPILPPGFIAQSSSSSPEPHHIALGQYSTSTSYESEPTRRQGAQPSHARGVSLVDSGPVPVGGQQTAHDPVRRVSRHTRRSSSRNHLVSPISPAQGNLPPGAVSQFIPFE
jgi:chitin synthase